MGNVGYQKGPLSITPSRWQFKTVIFRTYGMCFIHGISFCKLHFNTFLYYVPVIIKIYWLKIYSRALFCSPVYLINFTVFLNNNIKKYTTRNEKIVMSLKIKSKVIKMNNILYRLMFKSKDYVILSSLGKFIQSLRIFLHIVIRVHEASWS